MNTPKEKFCSCEKPIPGMITGHETASIGYCGNCGLPLPPVSSEKKSVYEIMHDAIKSGEFVPKSRTLDKMREFPELFGEIIRDFTPSPPQNDKLTAVNPENPVNTPQNVGEKCEDCEKSLPSHPMLCKNIAHGDSWSKWIGEVYLPSRGGTEDPTPRGEEEKSYGAWHGEVMYKYVPNLEKEFSESWIENEAEEEFYNAMTDMGGQERYELLKLIRHRLQKEREEWERKKRSDMIGFGAWLMKFFRELEEKDRAPKE